jgi:hypothetical protein
MGLQVALQIAKPFGSGGGNKCIVETLGKGLADTRYRISFVRL